jgi:hypothetical protein
MADTRPLMTAAELATHKVEEHGRDYSLSCDGYGDMEVAEKRGWRAVPSWGRDGWDLGNWPYVVIYLREVNPGDMVDGKLRRVYELLQVVEGDHTFYTFDSEADRAAAVDYLFLWYAAGNGQHWAPISPEQRSLLDTGYPLAIGDKWRGPFSWDRCNREATSG